MLSMDKFNKHNLSKDCVYVKAKNWQNKAVSLRTRIHEVKLSRGREVND